MDLYGHSRGKDNLPSIVTKLMKPLKEQLPAGSVGKNMVTEIEEYVEKNAKNIEYYCSMFDEEQERELEMELEEETQVERPMHAKHIPSEVSKGLIRFLEYQLKWADSSYSDEEMYKQSFDLLHPISKIFCDTKYKMFASQFKDKEVYVTEDFVRTVQGSSMKVSSTVLFKNN